MAWLPRERGGLDSRPCALLLYRFIPAPWNDDYDYWRGFERKWTADDVIVNVEHDMECSGRLLADLLACPHSLCTHAYLMHIPKTHFAHSTRADAMDGFWIGEGEEWAAYSGIGFCKIAREARTRPLGRMTVWRGVELAVNNATTGPWHVHWPAIEHHHR
jgi:hypothetical protein